ncbi:hypothetical protein [Helicobacter ailurogastricus]|uniref:hypothetical protein n=1 Tax=Helicobacter ailurogastricus TaxID=1578720 RepID=UPI000CF072D8|nr:hypothetical protein [Helicobacter ailurogastricus]
MNERDTNEQDTINQLLEDLKKSNVITSNESLEALSDDVYSTLKSFQQNQPNKSDKTNTSKTDTSSSSNQN